MTTREELTDEECDTIYATTGLMGRPSVEDCTLIRATARYLATRDAQGVGAVPPDRELSDQNCWQIAEPIRKRNLGMISHEYELIREGFRTARDGRALSLGWKNGYAQAKEESAPPSDASRGEGKDAGACWLIETSEQPPRYWSAGRSCNWSHSPGHAVRFKRADDAHKVMQWARLTGLVDARPVEHVWMDCYTCAPATEDDL
jgi:hypothetical protein